jgi:hypothetical protein
MPYSVGKKGSYGCSGYPVVKDDGEVMGCHDTESKAQAQITAINISESDKSMPTLTDEELDQIDKQAPCWDGYVQRGMKEKDGRMVPNCVPAKKSYDMDEEGKMRYRKRKLKPTARVGTGQGSMVSSGDAMATKNEVAIEEGDFVMGMTTEGVAHGVVEHIMWEGGTLGTPGSEYALESMPPENPAMSVRIYEEESDAQWEPSAYSIGMMYQDAQYLETLDGHTMPDEEDMEYVSKAEGYTPNSGMKAAARRAIKWKEDGKATGAGTPVGWGRARDIVAGRSMSLSVVKRMFSFFSRHEEASKGGKDFNNTSNPSNGRIMWDAWGGDAGFSWSRSIVERAKDKALFANFGKDYTNVQQITTIFND